MADPLRAVESLAGQVDTLQAIGLDELKLIEGKPMVCKLLRLPLEDPMYPGMWAAMEARGFSVVLHLANPEEFWHPERCHPWAHERGWFCGDGTYSQEEALHAEVAQIPGHPQEEKGNGTAPSSASASHWLDRARHLC